MPPSPWGLTQGPTGSPTSRPSCRLVADPALQAIRLSGIDLCVGLFIIEGRQQRHATFEALHGHHDVETFLDALRTTVDNPASCSSFRCYSNPFEVRTAKSVLEWVSDPGISLTMPLQQASSTWRSSAMPGRFKNQSAVLCAVFRTKPWRRNAPLTFWCPKSTAQHKPRGKRSKYTRAAFFLCFFWVRVCVLSFFPPFPQVFPFF